MKRLTATLIFGMVSALTVGFLIRPAMARPLSPQSNCGKWIIIPSPNPGMFNSLLGVAAISSSDVWAVGATFGGQTLTESYCPKK